MECGRVRDVGVGSLGLVGEVVLALGGERPAKLELVGPFKTKKIKMEKVKYKVYIRPKFGCVRESESRCLLESAQGRTRWRT